MQDDFINYIDMDSALNRVRGNKVLYRKMLDMFLNSKEFDALEEALAAGDTARAGDLAHAVKGMSGNLSFPAVFEYSTKLMNELRQGIADEQTISLYRESCKKTRAYIEELAGELDSGNI